MSQQREFAIIVPSGGPVYLSVEVEPGADAAAAALAEAERQGHVMPEHVQAIVCEPNSLAVFNRGWNSNRSDASALGPASPAALFDQLRHLARVTPHIFVGRHDRDCDLCKLPDRAAVHKTLIDRPGGQLLT